MSNVFFYKLLAWAELLGFIVAAPAALLGFIYWTRTKDRKRLAQFVRDAGFGDPVSARTIDNNGVTESVVEFQNMNRTFQLGYSYAGNAYFHKYYLRVSLLLPSSAGSFRVQRAGLVEDFKNKIGLQDAVPTNDPAFDADFVLSSRDRATAFSCFSNHAAKEAVRALFGLGACDLQMASHKLDAVFTESSGAALNQKIVLILKQAPEPLIALSSRVAESGRRE